MKVEHNNCCNEGLPESSWQNNQCVFKQGSSNNIELILSSKRKKRRGDMRGRGREREYFESSE
jgi:hypothetical protein